MDSICCAHGTQKKLSSDENVEEVTDPSSKTLSWTFSGQSLSLTHKGLCRHPCCHTSPRSGNKLSLDVEFMSSISSWTGTVLRSLKCQSGFVVFSRKLNQNFFDRDDVQWFTLRWLKSTLTNGNPRTGASIVAVHHHNHFDRIVSLSTTRSSLQNHPYLHHVIGRRHPADTDPRRAKQHHCHSGKPFQTSSSCAAHVDNKVACCPFR